MLAWATPAAADSWPPSGDQRDRESVADGVCAADPSADFDSSLVNPEPIAAELDWDLKLFDQNGDFITGEMDWYGPRFEP